MALLVTDEGEVNLLQYMLQTEDFSLRLYTGLPLPVDHPAKSIVYPADVTEVSVPDYAAVTLATANWNIGTIADVTTGTYSTPISFTMSEVVSVMGYFITDVSNTKLMWLEEFESGPDIMPGVIVVQPKIVLQ